MDQFQFAQRKRCKYVVIIEMVLAGAKLFLITVFLLSYLYAISNPEVFKKDFRSIKVDTSRWVALLAVIILNLTQLKSGLDVLRGCRHGADFSQAIRACKTWCNIELFRMLIFVGIFLLDVYNMHFNETQYKLTIPEILILLFGWFFANEYRKELSFYSNSQLPMLNMMSQPINRFYFQPEPQVIYYGPFASVPNPNLYNYNYSH